MRMSVLAAVCALVSVTVSAEATTQPFYLHYSSSGVTIPSGGDSHYYISTTAPTATTPTVTSAVSISRDHTEPLKVFTSTALSAVTFEKLATVTLNLSSNGNMNNCAVLSGTLEHVTSGGTATTIGQAIPITVSIPQGSGGGLVGYEPRSLQFALDVAGRQIPSGDSLRARVSVTNSCASNYSVRLVFDGTVANSRAEFTTPDMALYGTAGRFGGYNTGTIDGGATLATGYAQDFSMDIGLTYFLTDVTSDGTVFNGNFYTSANGLVASSCSTVITCFNPDAATCNDGNDNPVRFANIRIPDEDGHEFSPVTASPNACPTPKGGSDIADVAVVEDNGEHVQFLSSHSFAYQTNDVVLGRLEKTSGMWGIESLLFPDDAEVAANCPDGQCESVGEMERLPGSGHIVYAQYFRNPFLPNPNGVVFVTDAAGNLKAASYEPSLMADVNGCSGGLQVTAKSVEVDPSSADSCGESGCSDERFVVLHDNFTTTANPNGGRSFTFQEYRYDTTQDPPVLEPVTAALMIKSPVGQATQVNSVPCGTAIAGTSQGIGGWYDHAGNFWTGRAGSLFDVFVKDLTTGKRRFETDSACKWAGHEHEWGVTCPADLEFDGGDQGAGFADDPTTGDVLHVTKFTGVLTRFTPDIDGSGKRIFHKKTGTALDLNIDNLLPDGASFGHRIGRPRVDAARRIAWFPIRSTSVLTLPGMDHWLLAIDLPRIMAYP